MSLIVKGMEMPELEYHRCKLIRHNDGFYLHVCVSIEITDDFEPVEEWEEYPLLSVPPHGRLGDLDALSDEVERSRLNNTHTNPLTKSCHDHEHDHFQLMIAKTPTIIPADKGDGT